MKSNCQFVFPNKAPNNQSNKVSKNRTYTTNNHPSKAKERERNQEALIAKRALSYPDPNLDIEEKPSIEEPTNQDITILNTTSEFNPIDILEVYNPSTDNYNYNNNHITNAYNPRFQKTKFILDTAATSYIITNIQLFSSFYRYQKRVYQGQASIKVIKGYSDIYIRLITTNTEFLLKNCYYMPNLGINLILQLQLKNATSIFIRY